MKNKSEFYKKTLIHLSLISVIILFNNCTSGFKTDGVNSLVGSSGTGGDTDPGGGGGTDPGGDPVEGTCSNSGAPVCVNGRLIQDRTCLPATATCTGGCPAIDTGSCNTDPGGGGTQPPPPVNNVQIAFPPAGATSAASIVVRGYSPASFNISQVKVNGVTATTTDNYANWRAVVPLTVGANTLIVDVIKNGVPVSGITSVAVQRFSSDAAITRGTGGWSGRIMGLAWEPIHNRIIMTDDFEDGVWEMTMSNGNRRIISDSEGSQIGTGMEFSQPTSVVAYDNACMVIDGSIVGNIDLSNGNRSLFVDTGGGISTNLTSLARSNDGTKIYALATSNDTILKFNPSTGAPTVVAGGGVGTGTNLHNVGSMGVSFATNMAYVTSRYADQVLAVNLINGNRTVFSNAISGEPTFSDPGLVTVDDITNQVFIWDNGRLVAINISNGRRHIIGNTGVLSTLTSVHGVTMTPYGPALVDYIASWEPGTPRDPTIFVIDPVEGTRFILGR